MASARSSPTWCKPTCNSWPYQTTEVNYTENTESV
jgi:hypothetical protein